MNRNEVLHTIYQVLTKCEIKYVCIGSPFYADEYTDGDIDLIVHDEDILFAYTIIESILFQLTNILFVPCLAPTTFKEGSRKYLITTQGSDAAILQLDLAVSYHWRGLEYFNYNNAQKLSENIDGIIQLKSNVSSLVGAFKDMIYNQPLKQKRIDGGYTDSSLYNLLTEQGFSQAQIIKFLNAYDCEKAVSWRFICLWFSSFGFSRLYGFFNYVVSIFKLYGLFRKRDVSIAFYGPDGAGKSSIINKFLDLPLTKELFDQVCVKHTRPHILPPISWYLKPFSNANDRLKGKPARSVAELSRIKAIVLAAYYSLDYLLGRVTTCCIYFSRRKKLVIYDRYAFEFGYQQTFRRLPNFVLRWISLTYKKPLLNVFVYADPDVIKQRKNELGKSEIEYQVNRYQQIDARYKIGSYFLDTSEITIVEGACYLTNELLRRMN